MLRVFWRYDCRALRSLNSFAKRVVLNPALSGHRSWKALLDVFSAKPINVVRFEAFIAELEHHVKHTYDQAGLLDSNSRAAPEKKILFMGEIPEVLMPVTEKLLTSMIVKLQDDVNPSALYFADVRWLGLTEDRSTIEYQKTHKLDIVRKIDMPDSPKWRRCTRCRSCMEDIAPRGYAAWVLSMQKLCVCGNSWILETTA